jgi:hypothetical protein
MARVQSPRKVPRRDSITGLRLCSGILTEIDFAFGDIAKGGTENNNDAGKSSKPNESEADVRAREDGPGSHLFFVTVVSIARCLGIVKGGKPPKEVG